MTTLEFILALVLVLLVFWIALVLQHIYAKLWHYENERRFLNPQAFRWADNFEIWGGRSPVTPETSRGPSET